MVFVHCRTNLDDVMRIEEWPTELTERPMVGDRIQSKTNHPRGFQLELEVAYVTWKYAGGLDKYPPWYLEVYLSLPSWQKSLSIREWQEWYKRARNPQHALT
ncbi:hypothetical protein M0R72_09315 [Candidatus Pacearchaeota archaeon]|jgi:hypothetical protein|nr:hypothetical protein [Candidatus Pacearchaeota archaeon]